MADRYKDMLHKVLEALPIGDRLLFLEEAISTLSAPERKTLSSRVSARISEEQNKVKRTSSPIQMPGASTGSLDEPLVDRPKPKPPGPISSPKPPAPMPESAIDPVIAESEAPDPDKQALVEAEFKKLLAQTKRTSKKSVRKEVLSCIGLGIVGLGVMVVLAMGGRVLWDWLLQLAG